MRKHYSLIYVLSFGLTLQLTALLVGKEHRYKRLIVQYLLRKKKCRALTYCRTPYGQACKNFRTATSGEKNPRLLFRHLLYTLILSP
jgi:hypothetical protein